MLKVLHQLRTFGKRTPTLKRKPPSPRKVVPEAVTRTLSDLMGMTPKVERQESKGKQGAVEYLSDALRVAEWREIFELMDLAEVSRRRVANAQAVSSLAGA